MDADIAAAGARPRPPMCLAPPHSPSGVLSAKASTCGELISALPAQVRALFVVGRASAESYPDVLAVNVTEGQRMRAYGNTASRIIRSFFNTSNIIKSYFALCFS